MDGRTDGRTDGWGGLIHWLIDGTEWNGGGVE